MRTALAIVAAMLAVFVAVVVARLALTPKPFVGSFELHTEHALQVDEAERQVAIPLELAINGLEGVAAVHSHVDAREVTLKVDLKPGVQFDAVAFPAIQKTSEVQTGASPPNIVSTRERLDTVYLSFTSATLPLTGVADLVENQVRHELLRTPGHRDVEVCGPEPAVAITLDPAAVAAAGLSPVEVLRAVEAAPKLDQATQRFVVRGTGPGLDALKALQLRDLVRLQDVARVSEEVAGPRCVGSSHGRTVGAVVRRLTDAGSKPESQALGALPPGVSVRSLRVDRTVTLAGVGLDWQLAEGVEHALQAEPDVQDVAVEVTPHGSLAVAKAYVELKDPRGPSLLAARPRLGAVRELKQLTLLDVDGEELRRLRLTGPEPDTLRRSAGELAGRLGKLGPFTTSLAPITPEVRIELDRDAMARLGLSAADVSEVLSLSTDDGVIVSTEHTQTSLRHVYLRLPKLEPEALATIRVGKGVPLAAVARLQVQPQPAWVDRDDGERVVRFQTAATPAQLDEALKDLRLPDGVVLHR